MVDAIKDSVEHLIDLARDCYDCQDREPADLQGEMDGAKYCTWLSSVTVTENRKRGHVVCPFADLSVLVDKGCFIHPGCNYLKPDAAD